MMVDVKDYGVSGSNHSSNVMLDVTPSWKYIGDEIFKHVFIRRKHATHTVCRMASIAVSSS